jgi:predicted ATPase/class 3 adenylate cyclase
VLELPTGTITFLFTDIEGNTPLWERDPQAMDAAMQIHNAILRQAIESNGGAVFKVIGDEFQAAFPTAPQALQAALDVQRGLLSAQWNELGPLRVRMGIHTGEAHLDEHGDEYAVSHTKNRGHRVMEAGHGGQILLSQESADLCARSLPEGMSLKNLGEYHIRNLTLPERFFQVVAPDLPKDFPPLRTQVEPKHNLPTQLTSFVGREVEIKQVEFLLEKNRLVTLTGAGGSGKTRLALRVAEDLIGQNGEKFLTFKDGLWLLELAPLGDPQLIPQVIASIFGLREDQSRSIQTALLDYLSEKQLLLIFDNCEHLIAECAELAEVIVRNCPGVKILASSREALGVEGEAPFYVPSLTSPDPTHLPPSAELLEYAAVALFVERAQQVLPGFNITEKNARFLAQICRRLDGIPLAIELAAARVKVLNLEQIAARLDDRFRLLTGGSRRALPRHQTLRALIDWSYGLLSKAEQALLRRLSVFAGGWTLEAAEAICSETEVLDLLAQLVNKSLVITDCDGGEVCRYGMLETIRQYAQEKLLESDEAEALRDRHLDYYLRFAQEAEPDLKSNKIPSRLEQLDAELDNLRMALGWAFSGVKGARIESGLNLASTLRNYWEIRGLLGEGGDWCRKGLQILPREGNSWIRTRARACYMVAYDVIEGASDFSRASEARQLLEESIELYQASHDRLGVAESQCLLGFCLVNKYALATHISQPRPEYPLAHALGSQGLAICRELGDESDLALALYWNASIEYYGMELATAYAYAEESLSLLENIGDRLRIGMALSLLSWYHFLQGDLTLAQRYSQRAMAVAQELNNKPVVMVNTQLSGVIAYYQQDFQQMAGHFQVTLRFSREIGGLSWRMFSLRGLGIAALRQNQWSQAAEFFLEHFFLAQKFEGYDYDLRVFPLYMAGVAAGLGRIERAARLLGATEAQFETFFKPLDNWDQAEFDRIAALARLGLNEVTFKTLWTEGRAMTLEQAIIYSNQPD